MFSLKSRKFVEGDFVEEEKYSGELFTFSVVVRGQAKDLEKLKEYIVENYVNTGLVNLIGTAYDEKEIYLLTDEQWKEYQKLKKKDWILIGAGFP